MDKNVEEALIRYVKEFEFKPGSRKVIQEFCSRQPPLSITIYRGHGSSPFIREGLWYSATKDINIAVNEFSGKNCCVFIIHLVNVPCIDVNEYIGNQIGDKKDENEIIFLGGGKFYKDSKLTLEGYLDVKKDNISKRVLECWYSIQPPESTPESTPIERINTDNVRRALEVINPEEYVLIDSTDDIVIDHLVLTDEEKQRVLHEILRRRTVGGKRRTSRINTKRNKKRSKTMRLKRKKVIKGFLQSLRHVY